MNESGGGGDCGCAGEPLPVAWDRQVKPVGRGREKRVAAGPDCSWGRATRCCRGPGEKGVGPGAERPGFKYPVSREGH